jgi:general secretion pathway protein G
VSNLEPRLQPGRRPAKAGAPPARAGAQSAGFTIAELITVCAIITILSAIALPVARFGFRRQKEIELREHLRKLTDAIDYYHDLRVGNRIKDPVSIGQGEYPKKLEDLTKPIELIDGQKIRLLRDRDLVDPMTGKNEWIELCTSDDPDKSDGCGDNVFDVHSKSTATALDGKTHYNEW